MATAPLLHRAATAFACSRRQLQNHAGCIVSKHQQNMSRWCSATKIQSTGILTVRKFAAHAGGHNSGPIPAPKSHTQIGEAFGVMAWLWIFHRAWNDGDALLGFRYPFEHPYDMFAREGDHDHHDHHDDHHESSDHHHHNEHH